MRFEIIFYTLLILNIIFISTSITIFMLYWNVIVKNSSFYKKWGFITFICGFASVLFTCLTGALKMDHSIIKEQLKHIEQQDTCPKFEQIQEPLYRKL